MTIDFCQFYTSLMDSTICCKLFQKRTCGAMPIYPISPTLIYGIISKLKIVKQCAHTRKPLLIPTINRGKISKCLNKMEWCARGGGGGGGGGGEGGRIAQYFSFMFFGNYLWTNYCVVRNEGDGRWKANCSTVLNYQVFLKSKHNTL